MTTATRSERAQTEPPRSRPRLRGVSHHLAFYVAIAAGGVLIACTREPRAALATGIYAALLAGMFGVSAMLHRRDWSPRAFGWLRRSDHAMIFAFIAGTYTPMAVIGVGGAIGTRLLALAWGAAALGVARALFWPHAPRVLTSLLYLVAGWVVVAYLPAVRAALDPATFHAIIVGGVAYTLGACVYATRWPDPSPTVFGYHEVFHLLIIVGCACHFVAVASVVAG